MSFDDDTTVTFERDLLLLLFFAHARVRLARFERKRERERSRRCETEIRKFLSHRLDTVDVAYKFHWGLHPVCENMESS